MDIRAFGSIYSQTGTLPFGSGFRWRPADGQKNFAQCRAVYIEDNATGTKGTLSVQLADAPGQYATTEYFSGNTLIPIACTAFISGTVQGVWALY
jgi:hypothetical protein